MTDLYRKHWKGYYDLGLTVLPAAWKDKNPLVEWKNIELPVNSQKFLKWEKDFPNANLWLLLGDGLVCLDPDGQGAEEFVKSLNLPPCPTSISGRKSIHRWFRVSSPIKPVKALNGGDKTFLELRTGRLGMFVPPSIHPETKRPYRWAEGLSPWEIPFPELPEGVYEKIQALEKKRELKMQPAAEGLNGSLDVRKYLDHYEIKHTIKPDGARTIYALEKCLFADHHSTPDKEGDSSIIQGADGKLGFQCFHNHCALRTWKDAREAISGNATLKEFLHGSKTSAERKDSHERALVSLKQAVLDADQIRVMEFPEKRKILSPWLSEQTLVLVSGWRGAGKTWFALGICDAITRGADFGQWETITPVPVLYIDGEMAIQDIKERLQILGAAAEIQRKTPLLIYSDFYGNSLGLPKANLLNPKWRQAIMDLSRDWSVRLIVLDNLASLCPRIDENSKAEWDPINQWLISLRFEGISVMALHHVNKEGEQRGTSAREDNLDISINLSQPHDYVAEDGCRFILKFSKARIRTADLSMIQDTEFQLKEEGGQTRWTFSGTKKKNKVEVLRLISEGIPQKEIPEMLRLSKGQVSKIRAWLIEQDYLSDAGSITAKGDIFLRGN